MRAAALTSIMRKALLPVVFAGAVLAGGSGAGGLATGGAGGG